MSNIKQYNQLDFYTKVANLLKESRKSVVQTINKTMVCTYFEIGRMIVVEEQNGKERAEYGKQQTVSAKSENAIISKDNLQLSWSHYLLLMRINNSNERKFYEIESINNNWSLRVKTID